MMTPTISSEALEQAADWISNLDDDQEIEKLIDDFGEAQPLLFTYLLMMGEDDLNEEENELLLYLGLVIWKAFGKVETVSNQVLDEVKQKNEKILEDLHGASETETETILAQMADTTSQPAVFDFISENLEEESDWVRPANRGMILFLLNVMVDCLGR